MTPASGKAEGDAEFKREDRYIVIKISDLERTPLSHGEANTLRDICRHVSDQRKEDGKRPLECVIVESDWPEYEPTWKAIEQRMTGTPAANGPGEAFQQRVRPWMMACFGAEISADITERNHRFLEESLELVQSAGCTADEAHQLVDYVFNRPVGERQQEVGGVMVTLAALCLAADLDMHESGEIELRRIWGLVEKIRAKQAAKPKHSPLPASTPQPGMVTVPRKMPQEFCEWLESQMPPRTIISNPTWWAPKIYRAAIDAALRSGGRDKP